MPERKQADEVMVRLGRTGNVATWGWCEIVTHPAATDLRDKYVAATALGIAVRLSPQGRDAFESFRTLSGRLCFSRKVVRRSAWALEAGGWLDAVGNGPHGTIRWNATVPVDVYRAMDNAYHGAGGLPWRELLDDGQVRAAVVEAFDTVAAYVEAQKADRPVDPTTGATDRPVDPTTGATDDDEDLSRERTEPVDPIVGASRERPPEVVDPTVGSGVGSPVGSETPSAPTMASNGKGSIDAGADENACMDCDSPRHRWCGKTEVAS